jgi:phosphoglycolate phosphatase-like HAD superfamily hydrolase
VDRTLYLDLDSTLWDTHPLYVKAQMELFGKAMPYEEINHWYAYRDYHGDGFYTMFDWALDPDHLDKRELYPGVSEALTDISSLGFVFHIISHNTNPKWRGPYLAWLDSVLPIQFDFTLFGSRNDKVAKMKEDPTAFGIVEDKAETALKAMRAGYNVFVKAHPWNMECEHVTYRFQDWEQMPSLVQLALGTKEVVA